MFSLDHDRLVYTISFLFAFFVGFENGFSQSSIFLERWYWGDNNQYYILNRNLVHDNSDPTHDLFSVAYNGAIVYVSDNEILSFIVDPLWNRMIYAKYNSYWAKAYGEYGASSGHFKHPNGVATDGLGNIYVADTNNGRVVKLQYTNEEIDTNYFYTIGQDVLEQPLDLDVDDRGNLDPSDDVVWVADNGAGQIVPFTLDGSLWQNKTITALLSENTVYNDLTGVCGLAIRKNQGVNSTEEARIYLVDWKQRKLFLVEANSSCSSCHGAGGAEYVYMERTFASDVVLSGVESDYFGDVWVVDNANGKVYKYTWDLQYLDALTGLNNPTSVASVRRHHENIAITEQWTNTTGNRTYSQGANIHNLNISTSTTVASFTFLLTNYCYLEAKVYKGSTLKAILEDGINVSSSGNMTLNWYQSNPAGGNYTLKLWAKAYHDQNIYKYTYQTFTFSLATSINGPNSLTEREEGTWNANTTGGGSSADYQWYYKYDNSETWRSTDSTNSSYSRIMGREGFTVKVVVTSNGETDNATKHVAYVGGIPEKKEFVLPKEYDLTQNYPNPFNPLTAIKYNLPEESMVVLKIYDLMGREVRTLVKGIESAGFKKVLWDGKNTYGKPVSSGVYLYRLDAVSRVSSKDFHETRKLVLLR